MNQINLGRVVGYSHTAKILRDSIFSPNISMNGMNHSYEMMDGKCLWFLNVQLREDGDTVLPILASVSDSGTDRMLEVDMSVWVTDPVPGGIVNSTSDHQGTQTFDISDDPNVYFPVDIIIPQSIVYKEGLIATVSLIRKQTIPAYNQPVNFYAFGYDYTLDPA